MQAKDYIALQVWSAASGSFAYYWKQLQEDAATAELPLDVIYPAYENARRTGRWVTVRDLPTDHPFHDTLKRALWERARQVSEAER